MTAESTSFDGWITRPRFVFGKSPFEREHRLSRAFYHGRRPGDQSPQLDFDEATVRTAEAWLADGPREPWLLLVALIFPHPPFEVEEPWYSLHDRTSVPRPVDTDLARKPAFMRAIRERYGTDRLDEADWAELIATYYGMISRVDSQLGRVLAAVDAAGAADRTVTTYFTDHGEYLGDYGLVEKWPSGLDDCLLRNPLVLHAPGMPAGQRCDALVELVDLLPTLLELAGVEARHTHFGRSLLPLLRDASAAHRDAVFSEGGFTRAERHLMEDPPYPYDLKGAVQLADPVHTGKAVALRTADWTYIHRLYESNELYDRRADPRELSNLAGDPLNAEVEGQLRDRVLDWMIETADVVPWEADPRFDPGPRA
jgi:arylsulfatase A-like enzyme